MENKTTLHSIHPTLQFEATNQVDSPSSGEAAALEGWLFDEDCE